MSKNPRGVFEKIPGSGVWWIRCADATGRIRREKAGSKNVAIKLVDKRRTEILQGKKLPETLKQRTVTIGDLAEAMFAFCRTRATDPRKARTLQTYERQWRQHLAPIFADLPTDLFGTDQQRNYRTQRLHEGACNVTVNRELQVIRRAFNLAVDCEPPKVTRVPKFELVPEDNARKVFIDMDTMEKLKRSAALRGLWQRVFLEMAFRYGWRRGELFGLQVHDANLADNAVRLDTSKNHEGREVPITPQLRPLLEALVARRDQDETLFPETANNSWQWEWEKICEGAGVKAGRKEGIILHDARRSSARNKRAAGVSTSIIMQMQGWKTEAMFRRYAIVDTSDIAAALQAEHKNLALAKRTDTRTDTSATERATDSTVVLQ